jgi:hypothetical protein
MSKDAYFEMCEALGSEPLEEEIPVDMEDFPPDVQQAFNIYYMLKDCWDSMGGGYLGKDMSNIFQFFDLYNIDGPDRLFSLSLIQHMDYIRSSIVSEKLNASRKQKPSSKKA